MMKVIRATKHHCTAYSFTPFSISVTLKLWKGSSCVASWKSSGEGYVNFSVKEIVTLGLEYKLTADVIINGVPKPTVSVSGIC